ncbi:hypothetical protein ACJX0J_035849 [Zea mays]
MQGTFHKMGIPNKELHYVVVATEDMLNPRYVFDKKEKMFIFIMPSHTLIHNSCLFGQHISKTFQSYCDILFFYIHSCQYACITSFLRLINAEFIIIVMPL